VLSNYTGQPPYRRFCIMADNCVAALGLLAMLKSEL
jgi:hypothetical protein